MVWIYRKNDNYELAWHKGEQEWVDATWDFPTTYNDVTQPCADVPDGGEWVEIPE